MSPTAFLTAVGRSRLLDPAALDRLRADLPAHDPAAVADHLVRAGALTRFQADKLLAGLWQGLAVGPYQLLSPLGRGGMGIVYLARDTRPDAPAHVVALKVLLPQRARDEPRTLLRFRREMAIGPALPDHSHLARTTDAGEADGVHFLAMEYVPGRTVRRAVKDSGSLSVGAACRVAADAASGLAAAHAGGLVHRDVTPANLIVTPAGRGVVLDWGFALRVGEADAADPAVIGGAGHTLGTKDYLAPEQAADAARVSPMADVYALGCSLFFALTGCPPFPGGASRDKLRWHRTATPPPASGINPAVPPGLDRLIQRMMAKAHADRPTAAEAANELAAWADPIHESATAGPSEAELLLQAEAGWRPADDAPSGVRLPVGWRGLAVAAGLAAAGVFLAGVAAGRAVGF